MYSSIGSMMPGTLRDLDWRFLLPRTPGSTGIGRLLLVGAPDGAATQAINAGIADAVTEDLATAGEVDAVVVYASGVRSLAEAARRLTKGGSLYVEVDRLRPGARSLDPRRLTQTLRQTGVQTVCAYWVKPSLDRPEMYLPLFARHALKWYSRTQYTAISFERQMAEWGLRLLSRAGSRSIAPFIRTFAVTGVRPSGEPDESVMPFGAAECLPSSRASSAAWPLMLTGGPDDRSRVVILPFASGASAPRTVLKLSRSPADAEVGCTEQRSLIQVREKLLKSDLSGSIPTPLGIFPCDGTTAAMETYLPGVSLSTRVGRAGRPLAHNLADLQDVANWLAKFNLATVTRLTWDPPTESTFLLDPLARYAQAFGLTESERALFDRIRTGSRCLYGSTLPIVWQHHDFGEWNIQRSSDGLQVIDWERARPGVPLADLLYFVTFWYFSVRQLRTPEQQVAAFAALHGRDGAKRDPLINAVHSIVAEYMRKLGIHPDFLPILSPLTWVVHAVDQHDRRGCAASVENKYLRFIRALEF